MMLIPNIKALGLKVSEKKIFSCFPIKAYENHVTPKAWTFLAPIDNLNRLSRGLLGDATYQSSRPCGFREEDNVKFSS